ncbi:MAG: hypothetical protein CMG74_08045 [Candidatus Marinimicrobia bacterium]|nr:hypothetical protein [Candidatus Neomarinimicrobiota bacterium]|tara:strand:+ start:1338 stop:1595 length:258 start_codon:yes stop_codon:yes gene_type:complete
MRRFYRLLVSTLVTIGLVAIAPAAEEAVEKTEQAVCELKPGCCDGNIIADADVKKKKKKKKKKGKKGGKGKKKKKGFFKKAFGDK